MSSLRVEVISSKLKELKGSISYIKEFLPSDASLLNNRKDRNALYKEVESAIQIMIDICAVINSDVVRTAPSDEDSIVLLLEKEKVLSSELSRKILSMKGFRNVLVHRYGNIDDGRAFENITSWLKDFDLFIGEIESFLAGNKKKK